MNHSKSLRTEPVNRCTGRFFKFDEKDFFICNVLKGGSTSWSFFFGENNITAAFIADCRESGSCPEKPELRLLQVSANRKVKYCKIYFGKLFKISGSPPVGTSVGHLAASFQERGLEVS